MSATAALRKPTPKAGLRRRNGKMPDRRVVTFTPDGDGYGSVRCNWEYEAREGRIAESAAPKLAEGWHAELKFEAAW